jgi:methionyl aminopeptidase
VIELRTPAEIEQLRAAGAFVASVLEATRDAAAVGVNLLELDALAHDMIRAEGAESCYIDYHPSFGGSPFGKVICTSVNDAVLHGLPHDYALRDGDLVTLDLAVSLNGIVADSAVSFVVGRASEADLAMIETTRRALAAGIQAARADARVGDISAAVGGVLKSAGYRVNGEFGGHGVGTTMHQDPHIANDGRAGRGYRLRPGLLLAIEPWIMADTDELVTDDDGWTLRSATGARTAHSEHTIAITADGPVILTA